jgi:hypothetical protein
LRRWKDSMAEQTTQGSGSCFRCGAVFPEGGLRYRVDVRVAADTGNELAAADLVKELEHLLKVIEGKDAEQLEREVHADFRFYLCKPCKDEYMKGPEVPLGQFFFGD